MRGGRLWGVVQAPLSDKLLLLRHLRGVLRTQLLYRWMFRRFGIHSRIYRPLFISNADCIEIGDNVIIWEGVRLEALRDPFGRTPRLTIGSNTSIQQNVHIACHNRVAIGENVAITANVAIVDVTHPYEDPGAENVGMLMRDESSVVEIGDGAFIGYGAVIMPNVHIGKRAVIGANAVVIHDVPDYSVAAGVPARVIRRYSPDEQRWISTRGQQHVTP